MTNPYQSPADQVPVGIARNAAIRSFLAAMALLGGVSIAVSAVNRVHFYGGWQSLASMLALQPYSVGLWALTHSLGILTACLVCVGLVRKSNRTVFLGVAGFLGICMFAWAWPMDFLWFGGTR